MDQEKLKMMFPGSKDELESKDSCVTSIPRASENKEDPQIPDLDDPIRHQELTIQLTRFHDIPRPLTPPLPPSNLTPMPLRYPETLGTVISIRPSEAKGLGVFAVHDLPPGTILLCEAPLVTLIDTGTRADPLDTAVSALSPALQDSFHSLHAFSRSKHESLNRSIVYSNGYSILNDLATGVFETASRINHSCVPNSHYVWKDTPGAEGKGRMVFYNRFKLLEGEEVTVDYGHKPQLLKRIYGFDCSCGGCTEDGSVGNSSGSGSRSGESERSDRHETWSASEMQGEMRGIDEVIMKGLEHGKQE